MADKRIDLQDEHFNLDFLSDEAVSKETNEESYYTILVSDDEDVIHEVTKMILKDFHFDGKGLKLLHATTESETKRLLREHSDIAVLLQDVVMEKDDSGLRIVRYLRDELGNRSIRIILRTGQPGKSPEEEVIANYDINDYKSKTELTVQKLYTSLYSCLRSYRDIMTIEKTKEGLEMIIRSSAKLFQTGSFKGLLTGLLHQLAGFYADDSNTLYFQQKLTAEGFIARVSTCVPVIVAATGKYEPYIGKEITEVETLKPYIDNILDRQIADQTTIERLNNQGYIAYQKGLMGNGSYIFMEGSPDQMAMDMVKVFLSNFSMAIDNFNLHEEMIEGQHEIIFTLGEVIEKRSYDTANHIRRMSEICYLLGSAMGMADDKCEELKIASTMHDIGKISTPEHILMKPGKLTPEEFEIIKEHTIEGWNILRHSNTGALKKAAVIAKYHHERFDGKGYPEGLKGEDIPMSARITAVADVFDALSHKRCYKEAWSFDETMAFMKDNSGSQFDPAIIEVLVAKEDQLREIAAL